MDGHPAGIGLVHHEHHLEVLAQAFRHRVEMSRRSEDCCHPLVAFDRPAPAGEALGGHQCRE